MKRSFLSPNECPRLFIRVPFRNGEKVSIAFPEGVEEFEGIDLSVYGVAFLAPGPGAGRFRPGLEIREALIPVGTDRFSVVARVVYVQGPKVALEFTEVPLDAVWKLSSHVASQSGADRPGEIEVPPGIAAGPLPRRKTRRNPGSATQAGKPAPSRRRPSRD